MGSRSETMRVWLLGGFRISVGSRMVGEKEWRLRKAASLIKLLALAPEHRMHREQVMDLLWPELDQKAQANNLRGALHVARRTLDPTPATALRYLRLQGQEIALCPEEPLWVDVEAFEAAIGVTRRARDPAAYQAAVDLYAGDLLPEDRYEVWAEDRREALRQMYLGTLLELAALGEESDDLETAIAALGRVVAVEPTHEEARVRLMTLYASSGRHHEAVLEYERLRKVLSERLSTEPSETARRLYEDILAGRARSRPRHTAPVASDGRHNLPAERTSFVGREREIIEVERLLAMTRLLTLTGAGGAGKTRFALEVARAVVGAYPDGAWLAELAPLSDPTLAPQAVASALGVREQPSRSLVDTLVEELKSRRMLLVLDNCEHLVEGVARLIEVLLDSCPGIKVLATSREALNIAGETIWAVPPLSTPDLDHPPTVEGLAGYEAARLFLERGRHRQPGFALTPGNLRAVAEVCRRLGGIPLAIELAAARLGALSVEQISERLERSLKLLVGSRTAPQRQRTLEGALDWSFELLSEPEKRLFGRLSVFAGGWTLEAAEAVAAGAGIEKDEVTELLLRLVDKSLVMAEASRDGEPRYRLLEPVRHYGQEKLAESEEEDQVRSRHAEYYLALMDWIGPKLKGQGQEIWLPRLEAELDNVRAALRWSLDKGEEERIARTAWLSWQFWGWSGHLGEGRRWMEEALARGTELSTSARARLLFVVGTYAQLVADWEPAQAMAEESLRLFRQLGDKEGIAHVLGTAGIVALGQERHEEGLTLLEESVDLNIEVGDKWAASLLLGLTAPARLAQGDIARARMLAQKALSLAREIGSRDGVYVALLTLAAVAWVEGDHERAARSFEEGLSLSVEVGEESHVAYFLEGLAAVAATEDGESEEGLVRAARLWGAAEALLERIEAMAYTYAHVRSLYQRQMDVVRSRLAEETFAAACSEGRAMALGQVIRYALSKEEPRTVDPAPAGSQGGARQTALTRREREVALLVARELTNRQIANELTVSEHTVATHVRRILKKLGLRSRTQIASWAVEQELLS